MLKNEHGENEPSIEELSRIYSEQLNSVLSEDDPSKFKPVLDQPKEDENFPIPLSGLINHWTVEYYRQIIQQHEHLDVFAQVFLVANIIAAVRQEEIKEMDPLVTDTSEEKIARWSEATREEISGLVEDTQMEAGLEEKTGEKLEPMQSVPRQPTKGEMAMFFLSEIEDYKRAKKEEASALFHIRRSEKFISEDQRKNILREIESLE